MARWGSAVSEPRVRVWRWTGAGPERVGGCVQVGLLGVTGREGFSKPGLEGWAGLDGLGCFCPS